MGNNLNAKHQIVIESYTYEYRSHHPISNASIEKLANEDTIDNSTNTNMHIV